MNRRFRLLGSPNVQEYLHAAASLPYWAAVPLYLVLTLLTFPILELVLFGRDAPQVASDVFDDGTVPRLGVIARYWRELGITFWNPHLAAGNALFSQFGISPLSFDALLALLTDPFLAYAIVYFFIIFVSAFGMHVFLRESVGLRPSGCVAGSVMYIFSYWYYGGGLAAPALPLSLWLLDLSMYSSRRRWVYMAGQVVLLGVLFYNSQSQIVLLMAFVHLLYVLVCASSLRESLALMTRYAATMGLALMLYGPVVATQAVFLPESHRTIWDYEYLHPQAGEGISALFGPVVAQLRSYVEMGGSERFVGLVGLPLLCLSLVVPGRSQKERFLLVSWFGIEAFLLLEATVLQPALEHAGGLKSFQLARMAYFLPFALAGNIALVVSRSVDVRERVGVGVPGRMALGVLILVLVLGGVSAASDLLVQWHSSTEDVRHGVRVVGAVVAVVYVVALGGSLCVLVALRSGGISRSVPLLLLILVGERMVYERMARWIDADSIGSFQNSLGDRPGVSFLVAQPNAERHRTLSERVHPNSLMFHGLYTADGYQNIYPIRYHELFGLMIAPYLEVDERRRAYFHKWGNRAYVFGQPINIELASLMGVRWIYTKGVELEDVGLVRVFNEAEFNVYENTTVLDRVFVVHQVRGFHDRADLLSELGKAPAEELRKRAYVLWDEVGGLRAAQASGSGPDGVRIVRYSPDEVVVEVETSSQGILVLTDVYAPGWVCQVNGDNAAIFPVYNTFRGVEVPPGHSVVVFRYVPSYTYLGIGLLVAGVLLTACWCLLLARAGPPARGQE